MNMAADALSSTNRSNGWYVHFLLFIAGMGGLLYGIDVGIIAGALPYLESTATVLWKLNTQQLGFIVAAVLLGSVISSFFAGMLAEWLGRKWLMFLAGLLFTISIPMIAMANGFTAMLLGRLLQGISGGLIGLVVPLYLAECLAADQRGRGTGIFQLLLTIGLVVAALIGLFYAHKVEGVAASMQPDAVFIAKDNAWRNIFWMCLAPGLLFTIGSAMLIESPRWLVARGRITAARVALLRSTGAASADAALRDILAATSSQRNSSKVNIGSQTDSLLNRRYVVPFLLACLILTCNQMTGINSILSYAVDILGQAGLSGSIANMGDVAIKTLNALMTIAAISLVDRKGRKFLLMLGSGGIVLALALTGLLFQSVEAGRTDVRPAVQALVKNNTLNLVVDAVQLRQFGLATGNQPQILTLSYSFGEFTNVQTRRSDDLAAKPIVITRADVVQMDGVIGRAFRCLHLNPFADPASATDANLHIDMARAGPVPTLMHGWLVTLCVFAFVAFFAVGPGVCVWLALSELMPTRIRSNGMSIALLINQFISTFIAAVFLPTVGKYGYAPMFYVWAACTIVYFLATAFLLPETKGRTLEEIDAHFRGAHKAG